MQEIFPELRCYTNVNKTGVDPVTISLDGNHVHLSRLIAERADYVVEFSNDMVTVLRLISKLDISLYTII